MEFLICVATRLHLVCTSVSRFAVLKCEDVMAVTGRRGTGYTGCKPLSALPIGWSEWRLESC